MEQLFLVVAIGATSGGIGGGGAPPVLLRWFDTQMGHARCLATSRGVLQLEPCAEEQLEQRWTLVKNAATDAAGRALQASEPDQVRALAAGGTGGADMCVLRHGNMCMEAGGDDGTGFGDRSLRLAPCEENNEMQMFGLEKVRL